MPPSGAKTQGLSVLREARAQAALLQTIVLASAQSTPQRRRAPALPAPSTAPAGRRPSRELNAQINAYRRAHDTVGLTVVRRLVVVDGEPTVDYVTTQPLPAATRLVQFTAAHTVADENGLSTIAEMVLAAPDD
jgi:hypothetical protein